ncbi:MAG TPA: MFS transporter [Candidatus Binatia bacterium]|nr:MFS transporter [Candidatus Binatia bacterium]
MIAVRPPCDAGVLRGAPETPGCATSAKRWVLVATILGSSVAFVEGSVINVALPAIQRGLGASVAEMQWIASVFTLLLAALTLVAGSAGDRFGRRRLFAIGLAILAVGSLAAGVAASDRELIAARAIQGIGGALLVPNSLALLGAAFPKSERGRAIGTWSAWTALTNAGGPIVGGVLVDAISWRAGFLLVVPLALATLAIALVRVHDVRISRRRPEIDGWGAVLATTGLVALVFGIIRLASGAGALVAAGAGAVLLSAFLVVEARARAPMMPLRLFRSRTFLGANLLTLLLYFALTGAFFILPFALVRVRGYSATATGAAYLPFALIVGALSRWSGGLADRWGPRLPLALGSVITATGLALLAVLSGASSYWTSVFPAMVLIGLGMAVTVAPLTTTVMSAVDDAETGVASGVNNTVARIASLLAVAIMGVVAGAVFGRELASSAATLDVSPPVRSALAAQSGTSLGDVELPAVASEGERAAARGAVAAALAASFRVVAILAAALALTAGAIAGCFIEAAPPAQRAADAATPACAHVALVGEVPPRTDGCEECLRTGSEWVHLRLCVSCGHVGCCDASRHRHATAHFWATSHPIVRSLQPGEMWRWCYADEVAV